MKHTKKGESLPQSMPREIKQSTKSDLKEACTLLDLLGKGFKSATINVFKELKETMPK